MSQLVAAVAALGILSSAAAGTPFTIFPMMIAFGILWASG